MEYKRDGIASDLKAGDSIYVTAMGGEVKLDVIAVHPSVNSKKLALTLNEPTAAGELRDVVDADQPVQIATY